ncbi:MAG: ABC transporter ATP-binding protein/permease [Bacilli bacterium]|jgi:ATP-binding cassette subfamily B multidrug efflux pump|nr:ABC transporter ATP-binding protein/permease [Bacilli bacterium]
MKQLFNYLMKYKIRMFTSIILVSITAITALIIPKITQKVINDGIGAANGPDVALMHQLGILMIVIALIGLIAGVVNSFYTAYLSQNVGADMRNDGFKKIMTFAYQDIEKFKTSNLIVRLTNDINQIQTMISMMFSVLLRAPILFVGSFILAMVTIPKLWWVIVILFVVVAILLAFAMKTIIPNFGKYQVQLDRINNSIKENFEGARVVKSFVAEDFETNKFNHENNLLKVFNLKIGRTMATILPCFMLFVNVMITIVIYIACNEATTNLQIVGEMVSYINYLGQLMMALVILAMVTMQFSRAFVSLKRYNEIISTNPTIIYPEKGVERINGNIEFKNVTFTYPDQSMPSIKNVSFKVNQGETIGIIGATGAGKSTLVHLMLRLFDISNGEILLDGINIKKIPKETLRDDISIVLQSAVLFSGTVQENLINGRNDIDYNEMIKAASDAQASEFIEKMTNSYNSNVQQRGSNFSGGQKQRLSIARAFIGDPPILILDDSTSALDARSERLVKDALYEEHDDQTVIIIAQKIASIVEADKIMVLNDGELVGFDTHQNLLNSNKTYQEIFNSQKGRE